jgi:hypothetical protein
VNRLPVLRSDHERPSEQIIRAATAQRRTELAVFEHNLAARYVAECERIDAQALGDVVKTALEEELSVLDWGMEQATGSAAKAELVSRKVAMQSRINSARIARRFGM